MGGQEISCRMDSPLVSVIITTYNRAGLIVRSMKSVLAQTYRNLELIVVDDGSRDNTAELMKGLANMDKRVRYVYQENRGACAARNNGIDHAVGKFIAFHDSDDVWHADKLEKQIAVLKESGVDLVFGCMRRIENGKFVGLIGNDFREGICAASELPFGVGTQTLCADSAIFREERFDEQMPRLQDFELLLRISKKYKMYYINEPLVDYFLQEDSISMDPQKLMKAWNIILHKHTDFCERYKESERAFNFLFGVLLRADDIALRKQVGAAVLHLRSSMKLRLKVMLLMKNKNMYKKLSDLHKVIKNKIRNNGISNVSGIQKNMSVDKCISTRGGGII